MSALFIEKIIALKVIRNADRPPCGSQQVPLTEELKENIPVLGADAGAVLELLTRSC